MNYLDDLKFFKRLKDIFIHSKFLTLFKVSFFNKVCLNENIFVV